MSATSIAMLSGLDREATTSGLFGYNGCLVGCAFSVFLSTSIGGSVLATCLGGAASVFTAAALKPAMGSVPQWTLSFNLTALAALAYVAPLGGPPTEVPEVTRQFHIG